MGEKGSIKNLYKSWRLFLEEQKRKKKQKEKTKKIIKIKVFFLTFFTFLLSPFFFGEKKETKKSSDQIDILIIEIEKETNPEVLLELKKELKKEKKRIETNDTKKSKKTLKKIIQAETLINEKIDKIESKIAIDNIKIDIDFHTSSTKQINKKISSDISSVSLTDDKYIKKINKKEVAIETKEIIKLENMKVIFDEKNTDILEFLNYMKLEINTIEYKLKGELNIFQLRYLKTRITELNYKRNNFNENYNFSKIYEAYKTKDKYKILVSNNILEQLYQKCEIKIKEINTPKKVEVKEEKKEIKKKPEDFDISELKKVNNILDKEIQKQKLEISKLKLMIAKTEKKLRKPTFLTSIKNMLRNSMKICLSILPITYFKNKLVGGLASAFMLNNSIRSIRNLVNEEQIEYAKLLNNINNQKDCIFNTRLVYEDAITQIEFLKYDLLSQFSFTDLKDIFSKIFEVEEEIKRNNKILSDLEIDLEDNYDKVRNKTKKYVA